MFSPLKLMICLLLFCLAGLAIASGCQVSPLSPDMVCSEGFGLEKEAMPINPACAKNRIGM